MPYQSVEVVILGAGAAGLMAAMEAGRRGRRTLVLDHAEKAGKKILISGGGRCNFTNLGTRSENFLSQNPHFAKSALAAYTPADFIALVEKHGIPYHEKTLGQLFCDNSSREIVALLEAECAEAGGGGNVRLQLSTTIHSVHAGRGAGRGKTSTGFTLETSSGQILAKSLIVATGGLSIPKMGATGFGYDLARQFGLEIVPPRPALVPFTLHPADRDTWCDLSGVSAEVVASVSSTQPQKSVTLSEAQRSRRTPMDSAPPTLSEPLSPNQPSAKSARRTQARPPVFREKLLITHKGLSGPVILQISSYWDETTPTALILDLAPDRQVFALLLSSESRRDPSAALASLKAVLPTRWAERWLAHALPPNPSRQLGNVLIQDLERQLHSWTVVPAGTEGFEKAEVTAGGVSTAELNARTLESRRVPGLYFIGEVIDVTGWLGGYNFQWAWASGAAAGRHA